MSTEPDLALLMRAIRKAGEETQDAAEKLNLQSKTMRSDLAQKADIVGSSTMMLGNALVALANHLKDEIDSHRKDNLGESRQPRNKRTTETT